MMFRFLLSTGLMTILATSCEDADQSASIKEAVRQGKWDELKGDGAVKEQVKFRPEDTVFLDRVRETWKLHAETAPAPLTEILTKSGLSTNLENFVIGFTDPQALTNRAAASAFVLATPLSVDETIYVGDDVAFVKVNPKAVVVYEQVGDTVHHQLWVQTIAEDAAQNRKSEAGAGNPLPAE